MAEGEREGGKDNTIPGIAEGSEALFPLSMLQIYIITYSIGSNWRRVYLKWQSKLFSLSLLQDPSVHDTLFKAIEEGSTLLISNVSTTKLDGDSMLLDILQCRRSLYKAKNMVKNLVSYQ